MMASRKRRASAANSGRGGRPKRRCRRTQEDDDDDSGDEDWKPPTESDDGSATSTSDDDVTTESDDENVISASATVPAAATEPPPNNRDQLLPDAKLTEVLTPSIAVLGGSLVFPGDRLEIVDGGGDFFEVRSFDRGSSADDHVVENVEGGQVCGHRLVSGLPTVRYGNYARGPTVTAFPLQSLQVSSFTGGKTCTVTHSFCPEAKDGTITITPIGGMRDHGRLRQSLCVVGRIFQSPIRWGVAAQRRLHEFLRRLWPTIRPTIRPPLPPDNRGEDDHPAVRVDRLPDVCSELVDLWRRSQTHANARVASVLADSFDHLYSQYVNQRLVNWELAHRTYTALASRI
jgi:hypothetical protein